MTRQALPDTAIICAACDQPERWNAWHSDPTEGINGEAAWVGGMHRFIPKVSPKDDALSPDERRMLVKERELHDRYHNKCSGCCTTVQMLDLIDRLAPKPENTQ